MRILVAVLFEVDHDRRSVGVSRAPYRTLREDVCFEPDFVTLEQDSNGCGCGRDFSLVLWINPAPRIVTAFDSSKYGVMTGQWWELRSSKWKFL